MLIKGMSQNISRIRRNFNSMQQIICKILQNISRIRQNISKTLQNIPRRIICTVQITCSKFIDEIQVTNKHRTNPRIHTTTARLPKTTHTCKTVDIVKDHRMSNKPSVNPQTNHNPNNPPIHFQITI